MIAAVGVSFCALSIPSVCLADSITSVNFTGTSADPTITVTGFGFGANPPASTSPGSGEDFGNSLYFNGPLWEAGNGNDGNTLGLVLDSYSDTLIVFNFGGDYPGFPPIVNGDSFAVTVLGSRYIGTVEYPAPAPEPSALVLLGTGVLSMLGVRRKVRA